MGGGGRAGAEVTELIYINPAVAALAEGLEAGFMYRDGYWNDGFHETGMAISLVENDPNNFSPGGFSLVQRRRSAGGTSWTERYLFGVLAQSISPQFTMGLSVYNLQIRPDLGADHVLWNGAFGVLITLNPRLGFAYVLTNPLSVSDKVPLAMRPIPHQSVAANYVVTDLIRMTLDVSRWDRYNPDNKGIIQLGAEFRATEYGAIRMGYEVDDVQKMNSITAGFGFQGPRLRANYAFTKPLRETGAAVHSVDLRLPF